MIVWYCGGIIIWYCGGIIGAVVHLQSGVWLYGIVVVQLVQLSTYNLVYDCMVLWWYN